MSFHQIKKIKKSLLCFTLCCVCFITSCGTPNSTINNQEQIAYSFLKEIFTISAEDYNTFKTLYELEDTNKLDEWLYKEKFESYLTSSGYNTAMQTRLLLQGFIHYTSNPNFTYSQILLNKQSSGDTDWYQYTVTIDSSEYSGLIFFSEETPNKIDKIIR